jgi:hypothetical protein
MEELRKFEGLSLEELKAQRVELLPDREEMQDITGDVTFGNQTIETPVQVVANVQAIVIPA